MEHCYVFDYYASKLWHTVIPDDVEDIIDYLSKLLNTKDSNIQFIVTEEPLEIEEL